MENLTLRNIIAGSSLLLLSSAANASQSAVGTWTLGYDWYCDGTYSKTTMTFNADGTFGIGAATSSGKWWEEHSTLTFTFTSGTTYTAYHVNKSMTGVSRTTGTLAGCWYAHPNDGFNYDVQDSGAQDGLEADGVINGQSQQQSSPNPGVDG